MTSKAVLLIGFNRPDTLEAVFGRVRAARPPRLYFAVDGPRQGRSADVAGIEAVRRTVTEGVDWDCELRTSFRDQNAGSTVAVPEAISWFFEHEPDGIILEDDCLPDPTFFRFAEAMLDRFADEPSIMHVGGSCHISEPGPDSYFFSKYPHIWGWATWREAWDDYSFDLSGMDADFASFGDRFHTGEERDYWYTVFRRLLNGSLDSWDYYWLYTVWKKRSLAVYPTVNMVKNIGFTGEAVNTKPWKDWRGLRFARLESMGEIVHPPELRIDEERDLRDFEETFRKPSIPVRLLKRLAQSFRKPPG